MVLDLSTAGTSDISVGVQCHTDLSTCCSSCIWGHHCGDWHFPHGSRFSNSLEIFPNNEVHDNTERATVY